MWARGNMKNQIPQKLGLTQNMNTEFPPSARRDAPPPACRDGNLKCSVIWGIVRLLKYQTIPMTEQDKANIFDV